MEPTAADNQTTDPIHRALVVADWSLNPDLVVSAIADHYQRRPGAFGLLVPARLYGIDWTGDPHASRPCAERQLLALQGLCRDAGIPLEAQRIGDPETAAAIGEMLLDWPAEQIMLFERERRFRASHPLSLARRVRRMTGLSVTRLAVPPLRTASSARPRFRITPHCASSRTQPA